jgi:ubiquinone/menaquinone biosynthesis C-methylase UbiE
MKLTNRWNLLIYRLWSPVYDLVFTRLFAAGRHRALQLLDLKPGERVLIVGVGTGADLPLLPRGVSAIGVDLSRDMLARANAKLPLAERDVLLICGDAQTLPVRAQTFDAVLLNLILSVVPDGAQCWRQSVSAAKANGRVVIFDKFAPEHDDQSGRRRILNLFSTLVGTDITRKFSAMIAGTRATIVHDEPNIFHGTYRVMRVHLPTD